MKLVRTNQFKREFKKLPQHIKEQAVKKLRLLIMNPRHPWSAPISTDTQIR